MKFMLSLLVLFTTQAFAAGEEYSCVGTEPFWSLDLSEAKASFTKDGGVSKTEIESPKIKNAGATTALVFDGKTGANLISGFLLDTTDAMVADKHGVPPPNAENYQSYCTDGMSTNLYPFTMTVTVNGEAYSGCCSSKGRPVIKGDD